MQYSKSSAVQEQEKREIKYIKGRILPFCRTENNGDSLGDNRVLIYFCITAADGDIH